jgi:hypothetical protein
VLEVVDVRIDKALPQRERRGLGGFLSRLGRGRDLAPSPWWKRPLQRRGYRRNRVSRRILRTKPPFAERLRREARPKAYTRRMVGLGAVCVTTAGVVVLARRRRQAHGEPTGASASTSESSPEEPSEASTGPGPQAEAPRERGTA